MIRFVFTILVSISFLTAGCIGSDQEIDIFYGEDINPYLPANDFTLIDESFNQNPECFYGKAKAKCEILLEELSDKMKFNYLIFRMPPVLINHPKSNLGKLFQLVEKGIPIPSFTVGDINQRSFLNYDLLAYVIKLILKKGTISSSQTFNLSDSKPISTNDLLKRFGESINKKPRIIFKCGLIFLVIILSFSFKNNK